MVKKSCKTRCVLALYEISSCTQVGTGQDGLLDSFSSTWTLLLLLLGACYKGKKWTYEERGNGTKRQYLSLIQTAGFSYKQGLQTNANVSSAIDLACLLNPTDTMLVPHPTGWCSILRFLIGAPQTGAYGNQRSVEHGNLMTFS